MIIVSVLRPNINLSWIRKFLFLNTSLCPYDPEYKYGAALKRYKSRTNPVRSKSFLYSAVSLGFSSSEDDANKFLCPAISNYNDNHKEGINGTKILREFFISINDTCY